MATAAPNIHAETVQGFGDEWTTFDQSALDPAELQRMFNAYFTGFPLYELADAEGFDLGCGSGRWAMIASRHVKRLHCVDPSAKALAVARRNLRSAANVSFAIGCAHTIPVADGSQDFGYCLGVLHHVPRPTFALEAATRKLKPGAPFLLYLYYALDNRPLWFRALWRASNLLRYIVCRLPHPFKVAISTAFAAFVYWPLARLARLTGLDLPLSLYARLSFYTMRTDALDRFGTRLERRFTKGQVRRMMEIAGLHDIRFNETAPYWVAWGRKA